MNNAPNETEIKREEKKLLAFLRVRNKKTQKKRGYTETSQQFFFNAPNETEKKQEEKKIALRRFCVAVLLLLFFLYSVYMGIR